MITILKELLKSEKENQKEELHHTLAVIAVYSLMKRLPMLRRMTRATTELKVLSLSEVLTQKKPERNQR